jgi:hypothetical protein
MEGFLMATRTDRLRVEQDGLFTDVEHALLASWFGQKPPTSAAHIKLDEALAFLGFKKECGPYTRTAAAVAHVVLEAIEHRLPVWACSKGGDLIQARSYRGPHQKPRRQAALLPRKLFAINWASSGPGFDWPVEYQLVWVPIYERFIVTASADCPDMFGYADFALGHFARTENVGRTVIKIIKRNWMMQRDTGSQPRWEALLSTGLIEKSAIDLLADEVWPQDEIAEEPDELDEVDGDASLT